MQPVHQGKADKDHEAIRADARQLLREIEQKSVEYDPNRKVCLTSISRRYRSSMKVIVEPSDRIYGRSYNRYIGSAGSFISA